MAGFYTEQNRARQNRNAAIFSWFCSETSAKFTELIVLSHSLEARPLKRGSTIV